VAGTHRLEDGNLAGRRPELQNIVVGPSGRDVDGGQSVLGLEGF
jgi:hypothetical protein